MSLAITNPLRNAASPYVALSQVYEELQPFGPPGLMPPKIGVGDPRFAIDDEDGIDYKDHDLIPH